MPSYIFLLLSLLRYLDQQRICDKFIRIRKWGRGRRTQQPPIATNPPIGYEQTPSTNYVNAWKNSKLFSAVAKRHVQKKCSWTFWKKPHAPFSCKYIAKSSPRCSSGESYRKQNNGNYQNIILLVITFV